MLQWVIKPLMATVLLSLVSLHLVRADAFSMSHGPVGQAIAEASELARPVFVANAGQWHEDVLFRAESGAVVLWLCRDRIVYQARRTREDDRLAAGFGQPDMQGRPQALRSAREQRRLEQLVTTVFWADANREADVVGVGRLTGIRSYFLGSDPGNWHSDVAAFAAVTFKDVYPGVDLEVLGHESGRIDYVWRSAIAEALTQVVLGYGSNAKTATEAVMASTEWNAWSPTVRLIAPPREALLVEEEPATVVASSTMAPDALYPIYSTFLGGSEVDGGNSVELDPTGAAFVAGYTYSPDFPTQDGYDPDHNNGYDIFITKIDPAGDALVYSTYLGGAGNDGGYDIAVDASGCAYVTGFTYSTDYPTLNAFDTDYTGSIDVVVTKLSAAGSALVFSTYLGGTREDRGNSIAVDALGCAYVTGYTSSINFPLQNAYDGSFNGGYQDVFVTKLSAAGNTLAYSTYLGSPADDWGYAVGVDGSACAYVAGGTPSEEFPALGGYDLSHNGGEDAFVAKFAAAGNTLAYCTFLGGTGEDDAFGLAVDSSGFAYVAGITGSTDFPLVSPFDSENSGTQLDGFVTKLSLSGGALVYSTLLGGGHNDWVSNVAVDRQGSAHVTGGTLSSDFPVRNAFQADLNGINDVFLTRFSSSGNALSYSTFLGGSINEWGYGVAVDSSGSTCVSGNSDSHDFPLHGGYSGSYVDLGDVFVTRFGPLLGCCADRVGDVNGNGNDEPSIGDVSVLIDARFISGVCDGIIPCLAEADINQSGGSDPDCDDISIGDISILIDYLFITGQSLGLPDCL